MYRSHTNGELRREHIGQKVELVGWVAKKRNLGGLVFIDLRDRKGITQIVLRDEFEEKAKEIHNEYVLHIKGEVVLRESINKELPTGEIEVIVSDLEILNVANTTPLIIADKTDALEDTRLKYRYLDLRRPVMQQKLFKRHKITRSFRNYLDNLDFVEVETPVLTSTTPEGARDYLVPSRLNPGRFYALPQSPQLFKQLLMIAGFEKYYQVARCFRDEDGRSDRQPDFTQLDLEVSFMNENEVMDLVEKMMITMFKEVENYEIQYPIRRLSYKEAMSRYGSDKPDTRISFELVDVTEVFKANALEFLKNKQIKALNAKNLGDKISRKDIDALSEIAKKNGAKQLMWFRYNDNAFSGSLVKNMSEEELKALKEKVKAENNDLIFMVADELFEHVCNPLGQVRVQLGKRFEADRLTGYDLLWIVDFPMFEYTDDGGLTPAHHPFTRPYDEDLPLLDTDPIKVRSHHYDLVLNGYELGSGSLRIYDQKVQEKVFEIIGLTEEQIRGRFGYFIDAFQYGTPPHAGIGLGLDRIAMILTGSESIRDVIAFPKNASAVCPMTNAPTKASDEQLEELHIEVKE